MATINDVINSVVGRPQMVVFRDGTFCLCWLNIHKGLSFIGDPTAYVVIDNRWVWVIPSKGGEDLPRGAIETAERCCRGDAIFVEVP